MNKLQWNLNQYANTWKCCLQTGNHFSHLNVLISPNINSTHRVSTDQITQAWLGAIGIYKLTLADGLASTQDQATGGHFKITTQSFHHRASDYKDNESWDRLIFIIKLLFTWKDSPWEQGSWGQHGAHLGPTGPRWAPFRLHELCYLGYTSFYWNGALTHPFLL